jgi:hypothetical protein
MTRPKKTLKDYARCRVCGRPFQVRDDGTIRAHGHPARRCPGSGKTPVDELTETTGMTADERGMLG